MMLSTNIDYISTIFKTFDSDIDKWTSKIGVFGRSFNQIGTAVTNKLIDFNDEFERTGKIASSWKNTDSIWKRLYGNKNELDWRRNSMGEIVTKDNIDSYIAKISQSDANTLAKSIYDESAAVAAGTRSWEGYFNTLNNTNRGYVVDLIKNTDDLSKLTGDDLVQANQNARQAAIAHNTALKQQTLGAKAASVAMKGLALVGNVLLTMAITKGVEWLLTYNQRLEESRQEMIEAGKEASKLTKDLDGLVEQYRKLGEDGKLDNSDREQARSIQEQINSLLGDESIKVNLINGNYEEQLKILRKIQHEKANNNYATLTDAKNAADESLRSKGVGTVGVGFNEKINGEWETDAIKKLLNKEGFSKYIDETLGGFYVGNYYNDSAEDFIESYNDMIELRTKLSKSYSEEIKEGGKLHDFYKNLDQKIKDMSDAVTKYQDALADYNINEAVIQFNETEFDGVTGALIRNEDQLKKWLNSMLASEDISDGVKQELLGLASTYFPNMSDAVGEATKEYIKNQIAAGGDITSLRNLASTCGITEQAFDDLVFATTLFNNKEIDVDSKIAKLRELGYELDVVNTKMNGYYVKTGSKGQYVGDMQIETIDGKRYAVYYDNHNKVIKKELLTKEYGNTDDNPPPYTPPGGGDKGKDNTPDYEDPTDAIINRINLRSKELEQQEESIQNAIEIAELENDYKKQISLTNDLIDTRKKRVEELNIANAGLHNEAEWLRNSNPYDEASWFDSQGNATKAYNADLNRKGITKEEQERIKDLFENLSKYKKAYAQNAEEIADLNKQILQDEKNIVELHFNNSQNWIDERNRLGDWHLFNDDEVDAWERVVKWLKEEYPNAIDKIKEAEENLHDARKDQFDELTSLATSYYDSQKSLLQSHYDVINAVTEGFHEINKELEASKTMYEWLDEDSRKLLFNEDDYNTLSGTLTGIWDEALRLQTEYDNKLENATLETVSAITEQYEIQYETLMKKYEIAKAELDVAKKRKQLDNVLNEKNVKMLINGQWKWVANTQDVINAQKELADAEYAKRTAEAGLRQSKSIDELTLKQNKLGVIIDQFKNGVIGLDAAVDGITSTFRDLPGHILSSLGGIKTSSSSRISSESYSSSGGRHYSQAEIDSMSPSERSEAWRGADSESQNRLHEANVKDLSSTHTYNDGTGDWVKKHADGTRYTPGGKTLLGEEDFEAFIDNNGHLIPINQPTVGNIGSGGIVFNMEQMANLRSLWDLSNINKAHINESLINRDTKSVTDNSNHLNGDIIIQHVNNFDDFCNKLGNAFNRKNVNLW